MTSSLIWLSVALVLVGCAHEPSAVSREPWHDLSPRDAYEQGMLLQRHGAHLASVPYFRRTVEAVPTDWELRYDLATALYNASIETRLDFGTIEYRLPRSSMRVAYAMAALRELATADSLARDPEASSLLALGRRRIAAMWIEGERPAQDAGTARDDSAR